jgi:hypothetical protein
MVPGTVVTLMAATANRLFGRRLAAGMAGAAVLAVLALAAAPMAHAQEDEVTFEQSIIRSLLGGGNNPDIDYRERSPLVIPPSRDLPPPDGGAPQQRNSAWPQDPDLRRGRSSSGRAPVVDFDRGGRQLTPGELRRGAAAGAGRVQGPVVTESDGQMGRPLTPAELGETRSLFGLMRAGTKADAPAAFTGEPSRGTMTDPPPGYRTPSGTQPYAPPKSDSWFSVPTFFDRGVTEK